MIVAGSRGSSRLGVAVIVSRSPGDSRWRQWQQSLGAVAVVGWPSGGSGDWRRWQGSIGGSVETSDDRLAVWVTVGKFADYFVNWCPADATFSLYWYIASTW